MTEQTKPKHRPAYEIVLNALRAGKEVEMGGVRLMMQDEQVYCIGLRHSFADNKTEEVLYRADFSLNWFMKQCDKISFDDLFILSSETALMQMAQESAAKRERYWQERQKQKENEGG